eukprot:comp23201_c0_seq1/m.37691 comp23201_c0_seq1/g.37691  ORF comp23201_c0_seq1/g.37691 comp23201_c0_seq1/m.37691 type:complete len:354 (-) comp23201_c0_seq1:149-1210(-)
MSLWVDKHRPTSLDKLDYHTDQASQLKQLVKSGDFPHILVHGPSGAGKRTRIMCLLRELYGPGVEKIKIDQKQFTTPKKQKVDVTTVSSNYHIEFNPSEVGLRDCFVIQALLKEIAQTQQLDASSQKAFKVVVLHETDKLSREAQAALRRTMEKYVATCRLVLCCNSSSRVLAPIRSRCLHIRVAAPTEEQIAKIVQTVCKKENLPMPDALARKIAANSERNLRRALLAAEACRVQQYPFSEDQAVPNPDWEIFLRDTARKILEEQSPARLLEVRSRLYELMTHCIPSETILKGLLHELVKNLDSELKVEVTKWAAYYEHRMHLGSKDIFHLEAFVAKFMSIYKRFLLELSDM